MEGQGNEWCRGTGRTRPVGGTTNSRAVLRVLRCLRSPAQAGAPGAYQPQFGGSGGFGRGGAAPQ